MSDRCLILTAEQAARDWNGSRKGTELVPTPLANGTEWVLPAVVLERSAHAAHHDFLKELLVREVAVEEYAWWQAAVDDGLLVQEPAARKGI